MNAPGNVAINIRNMIKNNKLKGPNILACGLGLSVTGGHMDQPGWGVSGILRYDLSMMDQMNLLKVLDLN